LNPKVKVLHIIKSLGRGGAEMLLPETLKLHNQSRFEFHYIYFLPWKDQMVKSLEENGGTVTCIRATNNLQIITKSGKIVKYILENNIQLIHCHLPWAGFLGRIVHRRLKIPVIYTEHNKQERYHLLTRLLNRFTYNWQTGVIAVSNDVLMSIQKQIRIKIPVYEILNGVNTDYFQRDKNSAMAIRQQLNIPDDAFIVGTIAVFRFQKRLKEWLEVFAAILKDHPQVYAIVVGDGQLKEEIVQQVRDLKLEKRLILPGLQTDVKPWLSSMDVFMISSIFEGLPVALLEAMSMQCAIVTTDAGGIKEVIQHDKNGLMVSVDNWRNLKKELIRLFEDTELRKSLGQAARARVIEAFGMIRMVKELEELYLKCCSARTRNGDKQVAI
jgi:glycosyltransferase involved in cell wall biosynthesis